MSTSAPYLLPTGNGLSVPVEEQGGGTYVDLEINYSYVVYATKTVRVFLPPRAELNEDETLEIRAVEPPEEQS